MLCGGCGFSMHLLRCSQDFFGRQGVMRTIRIPFARVRKLFQKHCYSCHGVEKPKGKLRVDKLDPDLVKGNDGDDWLMVSDRLEFGDMPPGRRPRFSGRKTVELMTAWTRRAPSG